MKCKHCNKVKEEHVVVHDKNEGILKGLRCVINRQVMLGYIFEEEKFPITYDMGIGYKIKLEKNGWMEYSQGDIKLTLANGKDDIVKLERILKKSKELFGFEEGKKE